MLRKPRVSRGGISVVTPFDFRLGRRDAVRDEPTLPGFVLKLDDLFGTPQKKTRQ